MTTLLGLIAAVPVTILGPLWLLADVSAWPFVTCVAGLAAACCYVSRLTWRWWPDDEWFALWLFVAAVVWAGSGWLGLAILAV